MSFVEQDFEGQGRLDPSAVAVSLQNDGEENVDVSVTSLPMSSSMNVMEQGHLYNPSTIATFEALNRQSSGRSVGHLYNAENTFSTNSSTIPPCDIGNNRGSISEKSIALSEDLIKEEPVETLHSLMRGGALTVQLNTSHQVSVNEDVENNVALRPLRRSNMNLISHEFDHCESKDYNDTHEFDHCESKDYNNTLGFDHCESKDYNDTEVDFVGNQESDGPNEPVISKTAQRGDDQRRPLSERPLNVRAFDVNEEGCYVCWICLKTFKFCMEVKKHINKIHFNAYGAYIQSGDHALSHHHFLHFCPKRCNFVTSDLQTHLQHVTYDCSKPLLKPNARGKTLMDIPVPKVVIQEDHEEDNSGNISAEDLDVSMQHGEICPDTSGDPETSAHLDTGDHPDTSDLPDTSDHPDTSGLSQSVKIEEASNEIQTRSRRSSNGKKKGHLKVAFDFTGHVKTIREEKTFECTQCGKGFDGKVKLQKHMRIHTKEKPFRCEGCDVSFSCNSQLQRHNRKHTGEKPFQCPECDQKFAWKSSLEYHMAHTRGHSAYTEEKPFKCKDCGKEFAGKGKLQVHMRIHTGEKPFNCEECGQSFACTSKLLRHKRLHTGEKPFQCDECGQRFAWKSSLVHHIRVHSGDADGKPMDLFKCKECGKGFYRNCYLIRHMTTHTGEKPFQCHECGQRFTRKYSLNTHIRGHNNDRRFKCGKCIKSFANRKDLENHMRLHSGEKTFECKECGRSLRNNASLNLHMKLHTGDKPFKCNECGKTFNHKDTLNIHMKSHSVEKPFKCNQCNKTFVRKLYFQHHMRVHEHTIERAFKCNECDRSYDKESQLSEHVRRQHARKNVHCNVCGKAFIKKSRMINHMRIHTGEKPFKCEECGKFFAWKSHLKDHRRSHTGEKPWKCDECGRGFARRTTLQLHIISHTKKSMFPQSIVLPPNESFNRGNQLFDPKVKMDTGERLYDYQTL